MAYLDAATRTFYGVLVWGLSGYSPRLWELALACFGMSPKLVPGYRGLLCFVPRLTLPDEPGNWGGHSQLIQSINQFN